MSRSAQEKRWDPDQHEALRRTFGDLKVVDAEHDLRIPLIEADVEGAKRRNPELCAIASACKREFDSSAAVIFKTAAYVDILSETGERRVERFILTPAAREVVESFDRGESVPAGGRWLVLKAPTKGRTLDHMRRVRRRRDAAVRKGTYVPAGPPRRGQSNPRGKPRDIQVRDGRGQWQMVRARESA